MNSQSSDRDGANTELISVEMCSDCAMWLANCDFDPEWTDQQCRELVHRIETRWFGWLIAPGDPSSAFSTLGCEVCGSSLAGSRVSGTAFPASNPTPKVNP